MSTWWTNMLSALQSHLPILPVVLCLLGAVVLLLLGDAGGEKGLLVRRAWSLFVCLLCLALAAWMFTLAAQGQILVYRVGDWLPPFGIVLVVDRLSALMVLLVWMVALPALWYASMGWDKRGRFFHALFLLQLMGLSGAFVTGDLFNLFVFFEVLLIASYALLLHGQGRERFRVGLHYVILNLFASALFLIGVSILYALTGTLNMMDMAVRVSQVAPNDSALLWAGASLLLVVFAFKAAVLPMSMWLPATYANASAPVAALFAVMTKVGVYSIIRVHWVIFGPYAGALADFAQPFILTLGLLTAVVAALGAITALSLGRMVGYLTLTSVGTMLMGLGLYTPQGLAAALYYAAHSTLALASLFLLVELIAVQRGHQADKLRAGPALSQPVVLGLICLLTAASVAGLPPLPGFIGKLMLLQSAYGQPAQLAIWSVALLVGFFTLVGLARAGSILFWNVQGGKKALQSPRQDNVSPSPGSHGVGALAAVIWLMALGFLLAIKAQPIVQYTEETANQLLDFSIYQKALWPQGMPTTTQPYTGSVPPGSVLPNNEKTK